MFSLPSLRTRTRSLSITVGILWAIVQTVHAINSVLMIFWTRLSVAVSTDAVASSSTNIRACFSNARPKETSCLCPTLQLSPFSNTENQTNYWQRTKIIWTIIQLCITCCFQLLVLLPNKFTKLAFIKCLKKTSI